MKNPPVRSHTDRVACVLKEKIGWQQVIGGSLVVAGAIVLAWKRIT